MPDTDHVIDALNSLDSKLDAIVDKDGNIKKTMLRWLLSHESSTVALWTIMCALSYGGYWLGTTGIPAHLQQIHDGYEKIIASNNVVNREIAERYVKDNASARESYEKSIDRFEKTFEAGFKAAQEKGKD